MSKQSGVTAADFGPEVTAKAEASGKVKSDFFAAVRKRGLLNSMMTQPEEQYKELHPDEEVRWEFSPPNGDQTFVTAREGMGFHVVQASELPQGTMGHKTGPVRVGDMVLMAAPRELTQLIKSMDDKAALEDLRLPETTYRDAVNAKKVPTSSGEKIGATPIGQVLVNTETVIPKDQTGDA